MDYEKAYIEALERAKVWQNHLYDTNDKDYADELNYIFPELSESEDELTWLTKYIEEEAYSLSMDIRDNEDRIKHEKLQKALAWLEKQKEPELSEDLGEYIAELSKQFPEVSFAKLSRIAVRVKNWLENEGETEYALKSYKDEDVRKFMQQIKKEAKDYEFNLPNRDYDIYNFAKDILAWLEKQGENKSTTIDIDKMVSKYANTREDCTNGLPVNCHIRAYRQGINDALKSALNLEKQGEQNDKIIKGKNYFCIKTHNYAGVEWIKGTKYYASDNYTLVNKGCECYCPEYSKEEHNNLFEEVKYDGCIENKMSANKVEPKFKVGDKIRRKIPRIYDKDMQVARIGKDYYLCNNLGKFSSEQIPFSEESNYELVEQKPVDKVEPKFHEGEWITIKQ